MKRKKKRRKKLGLYRYGDDALNGETTTFNKLCYFKLFYNIR